MGVNEAMAWTAAGVGVRHLVSHIFSRFGNLNGVPVTASAADSSRQRKLDPGGIKRHQSTAGRGDLRSGLAQTTPGTSCAATSTYNKADKQDR